MKGNLLLVMYSFQNCNLIAQVSQEEWWGKTLQKMRED